MSLYFIWMPTITAAALLIFVMNVASSIIGLWNDNDLFCSVPFINNETTFRLFFMQLHLCFISLLKSNQVSKYLHIKISQMRIGSMMRVRLLDVVLGFVVLLVQQVPKILGREGNDVGRIFLDYSFGVVFEDVGQFLRHHDLLCAVDSLFPHVRHFETYSDIYYRLYRIGLR